jgi:hypothetical protein
MQRFNLIDHLVLLQNNVDDAENLSDQDLVFLSLSTSLCTISLCQRCYNYRIAWYKANEGC